MIRTLGPRPRRASAEGFLRRPLVAQKQEHELGLARPCPRMKGAPRPGRARATCASLLDVHDDDAQLGPVSGT